MSPDAAIVLYCEAWSHEDAQARARSLSEVFADGAVYCDPTVRTVGAAALLEHIAGILLNRPGSRVARTGPVDRHHDVARFTWAATDRDGRILKQGVYFVAFDVAGRITQVVGFFDPDRRDDEAGPSRH